MKQLKKLPFPQVQPFLGIQCPKHRPAFCNRAHAKCLKEYMEELEKRNQESIEYKHIEILNELIEELNRKNA